MKQPFVFRFSILLIILLTSFMLSDVSAQKSSRTDPDVKKILNNQLFEPDEGLQLINSKKYEEANQFLNQVLKKDDLNKEAYFKRGVVNWQLKDTVSACRDWSSVLALGDTATFMLLESQCHGTMIIEDEKIPSSEYKKLFGAELAKNQRAEPAMAKTVVEEMPVFPGGETALIAYFKNKLEYPELAFKNKIEGRVFVNFIISPQGKVLFPYVVRGVGSGCDEEAIRLIKNMPDWKPGKQKGKAVMVRYNLPVKFALVQ